MNKDKGKLDTLKRQLKDILKTIDDDNEIASTASSSSSNHSNQAFNSTVAPAPHSTSESSSSSNFASRAINNFRLVFNL